MPNLPHLMLPRIRFEQPRKKTGYGRPPERAYGTHGGQLRTQLDTVMRYYRAKRPPEGVDPDLILRIQLDNKSIIEEEIWERCGLTLLSIDENKTLVLFASDRDLTDFYRRLNEYQAGPKKEKQKNAPHNQIFACIQEISDVRPEDRIGRIFKSIGIAQASLILKNDEYIVDVELWDLGTRKLCRERTDQIVSFIVAQGGTVTDTFIGESLVVMRAKARGAIIRQLLDMRIIASVDLPPSPSLSVGEMLDLGIEDFEAIEAPPEGSESIAVLDSGIASAHPLLAPAIGEATAIPRSLGNASDENGHGTMVSGLALYGDIVSCISQRTFRPELTLYSARVLNEQGRFDNERLIANQMKESIEYFLNTYGCRVFNISLGDPRLYYCGGKVTPWAAILDSLARELDVVVIVSAGNQFFSPGKDESFATHLVGYPQYLLNDDARIIEPATGAIVLTIGALAHSDALPRRYSYQNVAFRPIASEGQPSPFTRTGPGLGGSIKPELCEYGGNIAFDGMNQLIRSDIRELSITSLNYEYIDRLFNTDVGTSFAAPRVAHMAAKLLERFPDASANLIRALLVSSASVPEPSRELLNGPGGDVIFRVCGYGQPVQELAQSSDESRVVLYAESTLGLDNFHIYAIPIPRDFVEVAGTRRISVTLAYDPPVRHSRFDYLGLTMSFRLYRGKSLNEVIEACRKRAKDEETVEALKSCLVEPNTRIREGGTLQKATFTMKRTPRYDYGDTYYLVIRCESKWASEEHVPQRYAVVAVLEHSQEIPLYNQVRQRVRVALRAQTR